MKSACRGQQNSGPLDLPYSVSFRIEHIAWVHCGPIRSADNVNYGYTFPSPVVGERGVAVSGNGLVLPDPIVSSQNSTSIMAFSADARRKTDGAPGWGLHEVLPGLSW